MHNKSLIQCFQPTVKIFCGIPVANERHLQSGPQPGGNGTGKLLPRNF